jgi:hypothetical protein
MAAITGVESDNPSKPEESENGRIEDCVRRESRERSEERIILLEGYQDSSPRSSESKDIRMII